MAEMKNYKIINNAISKELAGFIYDYFLIKRRVARKLFDDGYISPDTPDFGVWSDKQIPNTYSHYADIVMETLLEKIKPVIEGLDLIQQSITSVLDRFGIKKIEAMDQKFDHNFHQAMIEIERDDCEPGIVVQELIPGYTLHDRLLRPSMVGVSKKKNDNPDNKSS